jgi:hypothetical protein
MLSEVEMPWYTALPPRELKVASPNLSVPKSLSQGNSSELKFRKFLQAPSSAGLSD